MMRRFLRIIPLIFLLPLLLVGCQSSHRESDGSRRTSDRSRTPWPKRHHDEAKEKEETDDPWSAANEIPEGNVRIDWIRYEFSSSDRAAVNAALRYRNPNVAVSAGRLGGRNGLTLFAGRSGIVGGLRASASERTERKVSQQFLMLQEGGAARLQVLQSRPTLQAVVIPIFRGGVVVGRITEQITGSSLEVQVGRITPGGVDLRIVPVLRKRDGNIIKVEEVATSLTLEPNKPYVVMGSRTASASLAGTLLGASSTRRGRQVIGIVKVSVPN